ncbi:MAG: PcfJ domain-containing protein, partial [Clostridia bacterium]|nr:PcfJ domain-containing protein [Clostridia bacterium]
HCVGRMDYDQRIAKEQSLIFFIRKANEKEIPFVTVEFSISEKKVRQCYGVRDTKPAPEVIDFVNAWAKKAKRRLQNIQRKVA